MEEKKMEYIMIERSEYKRMCVQEGVLEAVKNYVKSEKYPSIDTVLCILEIGKGDDK